MLNFRTKGGLEFSRFQRNFAIPEEAGSAASESNDLKEAANLICSYEPVNEIDQRFKTDLWECFQNIIREYNQQSALVSLQMLSKLITKYPPLEKACKLLINHLELKGLHVPPPTDYDSKFYEPIAQMFVYYGQQIENLKQTHGFSNKAEIERIISEFDKAIQDYLKRIYDEIGKTGDVQLVYLALLLRRRHDMHRTFLAALKLIDDENRINSLRLVLRNNLAVQMYQLSLAYKLPPNFVEKISDLVPLVKLDLLDNNMNISQYISEAIILDLIASYREGSFKGNLGQEPKATLISPAMAREASTNLIELRFLVENILSGDRINSDFVAVIGEFLECEKDLLNVVLESDQRSQEQMRQCSNNRIRNCVARIDELPFPLNHHTHVALSSFNLYDRAAMN